MSSDKKLIFVVGATGAQGIAVIESLLAPGADGSPSPYTVRALTRDATHRRAQELISKGVEVVEGKRAPAQFIPLLLYRFAYAKFAYLQARQTI